MSQTADQKRHQGTKLALKRRSSVVYETIWNGHFSHHHLVWMMHSDVRRSLTTGHPRVWDESLRLFSPLLTNGHGDHCDHLYGWYTLATKLWVAGVENVWMGRMEKKKKGNEHSTLSPSRCLEAVNIRMIIMRIMAVSGAHFMWSLDVSWKKEMNEWLVKRWEKVLSYHMTEKRDHFCWSDCNIFISPDDVISSSYLILAWLCTTTKRFTTNISWVQYIFYSLE